MIFFETAGSSPDDQDNLTVVVSQLRLKGINAAIIAKSDFHTRARNQQFDLAHLLTDIEPQNGDRFVIIDAHKLGDTLLAQLRRISSKKSISCLAVGRFETAQSEIGTKAKLSYVLGSDPDILSTFDTKANGPTHDVPVIGVCGKRANASTCIRPTVLLFEPDMDDPNLRFFAASGKFKVIIMTSGKAKDAWTAKYGSVVPMYHFSEILPSHLAPMVDIFVTFKCLSPHYRVLSLVANLMAEGAALIDCTENLSVANASSVFIRGPRDIMGLSTHLSHDVIPQLPDIRAAVHQEYARTSLSREGILSQMSGRASAAVYQSDPEAPKHQNRVIIVPTNGVGLGHAQRTSLIATELNRNLVDPVFAAFPSCLKMINSYGFDAMPLVSRSTEHAQPHANDMLNYLRLREMAKDASTLVFDGGYVFDSIFRAILDEGLNGIWIRRGMWQPGQNNAVSLDREKVFGRVIVPAEAFEELNHTYSTGDHISQVGPIVQKLNLLVHDREEVRAALSERFGKSFHKLVVTMLGAGVAAKRTAQIQAICGMMDARNDVLNLVVVWPTATTEAGAFVWDNSRVVKTHHASPLVAACDLFISGVGYNSFHEALYNRVPTIFMPQMASFMDDQHSRAVAAVDRGLAEMVGPTNLMALRKHVGAFLDQGKDKEIRERLEKYELPETGNRAAAAIIETLST